MRIELKVVLILITACVIPRLALADTPISGGPRNLLITYRSEPANRPAFRTYLQSEARVQLDKLEQRGVIESYQILFNPVVSSGTWDALLILSFAKFADIQQWQQLERTSPGGLSPKALRFAKPVDSYFADLTWSGVDEKPASERDSVFYVIPYEYNSADQYRSYVDSYVIPQVQGWMREGVLAGYRIFMNRFPVGPTWDALFIYQYRDLDHFGRRDEIIAKVRRTLVDDPVWKHLSEIKQTIRSESENTVCESLISTR